MKNSSFFFFLGLFLINLASDQLLLLFLLMSAFTWNFREPFHVRVYTHLYCACVCVFHSHLLPLLYSILCAWI